MKRLLILVLTCCMFTLSGCGGKPTGNTDLPEAPIPILTEQQMKGVKIENKRAAENFRLVCDQIGIVPDEITSMKKSEGWTGGDSYTFTYAGTEWSVYCNRDSTVAAVMLGDMVDIFNKETGAYHMTDYVVDSTARIIIESRAQNTLKEYLGISESEALQIPDLQLARVNNIYEAYGSVLRTDGEEQKAIPFSMCFEYFEETNGSVLRYLILDNEEMLNEIESIPIPERTPAVKQK